MRKTTIANILQHILVTTIASTTMAGCGGIDTDDYDQLGCIKWGQPEVLSGVSLEVPADYIERRRHLVYEVDQPWDLAESTGTPCATATDHVACKAAIRTATSEATFIMGSCSGPCDQYILIVNRGDDVEVISDTASVKDLLGTIDTPQEAVMVAELAGYDVACGDVENGGVRAAGSSYELIATATVSSCAPLERQRFQLSVTPDGEVQELDSEVISSDSGTCVGRRPSRIAHQPATGATQLGAYFASMTHLEDAAVHAFAELHRELAYYDAPAELLERTERSRQDEVRHVLMMQKLSQRFGGKAPQPKVQEQPVRSLEEIARHNAVEGCVRETFGALVGMWQGRFAKDESIRATMQHVAEDETRHAALSWEIHRWARAKLSDEANARIDRAQETALAELRREVEAPVDSSLRREAGVPAPHVQRQLAQQFAAHLAA